MPRTARSIQAELKQTKPFRSRSAEAAVALLRTADLLKRRLERVIEPEGITGQQYNVLRILRGAKGAPMATLEIGSRLIEQTPGITRLLDRLEGKGLVHRERCPTDRRQVHCFITPSGRELLDRIDPQVDAAEDLALRNLSARELEVLLESLERIRAAG